MEPSKEIVNKILNLFQTNEVNLLQNEIEKAINLYPEGATSWLFLGMFYNRFNSLKEAEDALLKSLQIKEDYPEAQRMYADVLRKIGKIDESIVYAKKVVTKLPDYAAGYDTLGTCYATNKEYLKAEDAFQKGIEIDNSNPIILNNLANTKRNLGKFIDSINILENAVDINSNIPEIKINLVLSLFENKEFEKALKILNESNNWKLDKSNKSSLLAAYGHIYKKTYQLELSNKYYLESLEYGDNVQSSVYNGLASNYVAKRDFLKAIKYFKKSIEKSPLKNDCISNYIMTYSYLFKTNQDKIFQEIRKYAKEIQHPDRQEFQTKISNKKKLKIGFISGDFFEHPVSYFLIDFISFFDDERFESFAYYNYGHEDSITLKLKDAFGNFKNISGLSDKDKLKIIIEDEIDILIDLAGHTSRNCMSIMKAKAAPLQATWLGFSETTGLNEIDYIICDETSIMKDEEKFFTEKPLKLKNSYYCFSYPGKPENFKIENKNQDTIIFGNFSNTRKITNDIIELWSDILLKVDNSFLLLKSEMYRDKDLKEDILIQFKKNNIPKEKIIFEFDELREDYLLGYNKIDAILDTFPYPGGTTTCEALYMGTPVITMKGNRFLERNGENIIKNADLELFLANDKQEYLDKAVNISNILKKNNLSKTTIREKFMNSSIMKHDIFVQDFKSKLESIWKEYNKNYE